MRPIIIHTRRFPPRGYQAVTLFPFVFYRNKPFCVTDRRHETVHLWQQAALLVLPFYVLYLVFWLIGLVRYRDHDKAYRNIPFERSAYRLEKLDGLRPRTMAFHWLRCL